MPLTRYQIRNEYSLADPELYRAADRDDPEALLEGVAMAGLVGVLRQLGDLAEFAAEIFHDLHEEVMATAARGHSLMVRVQQLEAEFPSIENAFLSQTDHSLFFTNAGVDWHPNLRMEQNLITRGDLPRCVMDSYEECRGPPRLFLLDKFDVAGAGACLKRYTDPSFFKVEAAPSEVPSVEVQREKKIRKVKKKGSRWRNGETPEVVPTSHAKLHQLFLEESIEKAHSDPARLVKLKKRQLNASPFDSRSGRSYMKRFLETTPERNVVRDISVTPLPLKMISDNSSESGLEIHDVNTVSPVKRSPQGNESTCTSPDAHEVVIKPSMDELYGEVTGRQIVKVPESSADDERDEIPSSLHKVTIEKEIVVDEEGKAEPSVDGDNSDDMTSEVDNYMDALTSMESEMEIDNDYRPKTGPGFSNIEKHEMDSDRNGEKLEFQAHSSDTQTIGNFSASDDGNSSFKKGMSSFSCSDTLSTLAENIPSDGERSATVFPSSEAFVPQITEMPSDQLRADVGVLGTKSHDLVLPNDMSIEEDISCHLGETSTNSSFIDPNPPLLALDPADSSVQQKLDVTPSEATKPGSELQCIDERETNLDDSLAAVSEMHSQTKDGTPFTVCAESHPVDELDGGNPNVYSDDLWHLSNNPEVDPEKKSSNDSPDELLQTDFAEENCPENMVNKKVGSPSTITSPTREQVPCSVLPEVEVYSGLTSLSDGSDVGKHDDIVSKVDDAFPEVGVNLENSTSMVDTAQNYSFKGQQVSDILDKVQQEVERDSAEKATLYSEAANHADISGPVVGVDLENSTSMVDTAQNYSFKGQQISDILDKVQQEVERDSAEKATLYSEAANHADISGPVDSEKIVSSCMVEVIEDGASFEIPSNGVDSSVLEDHVSFNDLVAEAGQAENMSVPTTAAADVPAEACVDVDTVVHPPDDIICSPSKNIVNFQESPSGTEDPHKDRLEFNELVSPECIGGSEAENKMTQLEVVPKDFDSASSKLVPSDESNLEMVHGVHNLSLAETTQDSLPAGDFAIPPASLEHSDQDIESKCLQRSFLLEDKEDSTSSPAAHLPDPDTSSDRSLELLAVKLDGACLKGEASSDSPIGLSEGIQSSNDTNQEKLFNDASESWQEDFSSQPSPSEGLGQSAGLEINNTKQEMDPLGALLPSFGLLHEATQNLDEMPPLPPLPPMQWRLGKMQHDQLVAQKEFIGHSQESFPSSFPFGDHEKDQSGFPSQQRGILQPVNPFLPVSSVEVEELRHLSEQEVSNQMQPSLSTLELPSMTSDANNQKNNLALEGTQFLNPFLKSSMLPDDQPEHEEVQSSLNPFLSLPAVEDSTSKHELLSSPEKQVCPLNELEPEPGLEDKTLQHTAENSEGEHGNHSDTSLSPSEKVEKQPQHGLQSSEGKMLQHTPENSEGECENPSDMSVLPPGKVEEQTEHGLPNSEGKTLLHTPEKSEGEHGNPSGTSVLPHGKVEEQSRHGLQSSEGESAWSSNPFVLLPTSEVGKANGNSIVKLPRPRSPLIDAVAAHDKSKLRKVTERVRPQIGPKEDERDSLLEQIRTKSFNLKPAVVSRPSIQGPKTNLRVAAILEKANAIRQATAGSDEDDDEDWSDS
ncbi:protein SCAR2-like isoform X2 [Melia azedarach]|uniref:Protein SCAR2-like isoform X2 n=1 Tax=Melia azedarach TaxID=155640 RepID=A0ACC1X156_MELAZ|nr:protein SCAR2-like isoform X2 [Melia azedarach]